MRLKEEQIATLADRIVADLETDNQITLKTARQKAVKSVAEAIRTDLKAEEDLEREAEQLLERTLRTAGDMEGIDRNKMLKMIKTKRAKDRKLLRGCTTACISAHSREE